MYILANNFYCFVQLFWMALVIVQNIFIYDSKTLLFMKGDEQVSKHLKK